MRRSFCAVLLGFLALPAQAETAMTPAEFEAYVSGKTLSYAESGVVWGAEQYLPDRKVIWAFTDDICSYGVWYAVGDQICFLYEDQPDPQCWAFFAGANGLTARYMNQPGGTALAELAQSPDPLPCPGPDLGV